MCLPVGSNAFKNVVPQHMLTDTVKLADFYEAINVPDNCPHP